LASRYSVFLTTSVEAQLRNAPPQLQGYVAGIVALLRADPTAASVVFDIIEGERYRTIVFPEGRGFLDYQVFEERHLIVLTDLIWFIAPFRRRRSQSYLDEDRERKYLHGRGLYNWISYFES
jgi:hypothetical protein